MGLSQQIDSEHLHHAYVLEGAAAAMETLQQMVSERLGIVLAGNQDVVHIAHDVFGIEEARELTRAAQVKAVRERSLFFIQAGRITNEAQNALLKLLEDAPARTHFFVVVPQVHILLPTLHSRVVVLGADRAGSEQEMVVQEFLKEPMKDRLERVASVVEAGESVAFLNALEQQLYASPEHKGVLAHLLEVKKYSTDTGAPKKMLLESLAVLI